MFVPLCGIGQVELPSFTIELLLGVAIPRRALKSLKKRDFDVGFVVVRFLGKIDQKLNNRDLNPCEERAYLGNRNRTDFFIHKYKIGGASCNEN